MNTKPHVQNDRGCKYIIIKIIIIVVIIVLLIFLI